MFNSKSTLLAQSVLLLASYASCQGDAAPNGTLYIPGISELAGVLGTPAGAIVASRVTIEDASTVFQIVDALPTAVLPDPLTATLVISPTGAHLSADAESDGLGDIDINCSIAGGRSSCQLSAAAGGVAITSFFTEPTSGVPVVAVNFASASGSASGSGSGSASAGSSPTAGSSSSSASGSTTVVNVTVTPSVSVSVTSGAVSSNSGSSSSSSSASSTAPAPATSTTQPSSATNVHVSMVTMLFGLIVAFSLASL